MVVLLFYFLLCQLRLMNKYKSEVDLRKHNARDKNIGKSMSTRLSVYILAINLKLVWTDTYVD